MCGGVQGKMYGTRFVSVISVQRRGNSWRCTATRSGATLSRAGRQSVWWRKIDDGGGKVGKEKGERSREKWGFEPETRVRLYQYYEGIVVQTKTVRAYCVCSTIWYHWMPESPLLLLVCSVRQSGSGWHRFENEKVHLLSLPSQTSPPH